MTRLELAHRALLRDRSFQWDFPQAVPPRQPGWLTPLLELLKAMGAPLAWVFWIVLALALLALLVVIGRELLRGSSADRAEGVTLRSAGFGPPPARARALLAEADALAAAGDFGEAAHLLLLRTLQDLDARRPGLLKPATTAREIAASPAAPEAVRAPLARLAARVEAHLFAGRETVAGQWAAARADYEAFLRAVGA